MNAQCHIILIIVFVTACSNDSPASKPVPITNSIETISTETKPERQKFAAKTPIKQAGDDNVSYSGTYQKQDVSIETGIIDAKDEKEKPRPLEDNTENKTANTRIENDETPTLPKQAPDELAVVIESNTAPTLSHPAFSIEQGGTVVFDNTHFNAQDEDLDSLVFIMDDIKQGSVTGAKNQHDGTKQFSMEQLSKGDISFTHDGYNLPPEFSIVVSDGEFQTAAIQMTIDFIKHATPSKSDFSHKDHFEKLPGQFLRVMPDYYKPSTDWYRSSYNLAKYGGYLYLYNAYDGFLPTGRNLAILQAESNHTPASAGSVTHLVRSEASNSHSETVAGILNQVDTYPLLYTQYKTYSTGLKHFHTIDTADLRQFIDTQMTLNQPYFSVDHQGNDLQPAKMLNISNTNGGSSLQLVNQMDRFVSLNDLVACTAHSSLTAGNWTTSGTQYNSIVVDYPYGNHAGSEKLKGTKLNSHGIRQKPDLTAFAKSQASSYATPMVCSGAAMLLERAYTDKQLANARKSIVIKSIIMAGATRFDYKLSTDWGEGISQAALSALPSGEWVRVSEDMPLSQHYGAGLFNIHAAYLILDAGEQDHQGVVRHAGWDYKNGMTVDAPVNYKFTFDKAVQFSALMTWHREINSNFDSFLPDYTMALYRVHEGRVTPVAISDNTTSNVELVDISVDPGNYRLTIQLKDTHGASKAEFSLAWNHKKRAPQVDFFEKNRVDDCYQLSWGFNTTEASDYKYRLRISTDANYQDITDDIYTELSSHCLSTAGRAEPFFLELITYPLDKHVAVESPSSAKAINYSSIE